MAAASSTNTQGIDTRRPRRERILDGLRTIVINLLYTALVLVVGYSLIVTYKLKQHETWQKKVEVAVAKEQLDRDTEINDELKRQIQFLRTADGAEKVARERLGLIRPNESTFVVVNAPQAPAAPRSKRAPITPQEPPAGDPLTVQAWRAMCQLWNGGE